MLRARMRSQSADRGRLIRRLAPLCLLTTIDALAKWNVALKLGREPGTSMPETWAANGARFFLQTQVEFGDGAADDATEPFLGKREQSRCSPEPAFYTDITGRKEVLVGDGAWVLAKDRAPAVLRFWLDFSQATDVESRGVALPAERLVFTASTFDAAAVADARRGLLPAKQAQRAAQTAVDELKDDPKNLFSFAQKSDALAAATAAVARVEAQLPGGARDPTAGYLPGEEKLYVDQGPISVKRRGPPFFREKYFVVGTFSLTPVLEGAELAASKRLYY